MIRTGTAPPPDLRRRIEALAPWFHNMDLGGIMTAPDHFLGDYPSFKWRGFAHALPADLHGCSVLDIGCNAVFYTYFDELQQRFFRRGRSKVLVPAEGAQAEA